MNRHQVSLLFLALLFLFPATSFGAATLEIPGTGDSQALLRDLAAAFNAGQQEIEVVIPDSIGSGGAIKSVAGDKNELGRVARPIKKKEQRYNLNYLQFAASPVVFAVSGNVGGVDNLTPEEALAVYAAKTTNWSALGGPPESIYLIGREPGDSSREAVEEIVPGFGGIENYSGIVAYSTPEAVDMLATHDNSIAYLPFSMTSGRNVRVLKFGGKGPLDPGYPLLTPFGMVWKGKMSGPAAGFMDFIFSDRGRKIITAAGAVAVARKP
ncbi:MAG: substrate-binding domain-containing protein [Proteobacteria bacterium]|nr:substrate-binding domain-containing protein [Pseudomonadota bacterium]MBU1739254.1 substrate-binding domain-containing protein [Pseudomonadota bacterium]